MVLYLWYPSEFPDSSLELHSLLLRFLICENFSTKYCHIRDYQSINLCYLAKSYIFRAFSEDPTRSTLIFARLAYERQKFYMYYMQDLLWNKIEIVKSIWDQILYKKDELTK